MLTHDGLQRVLTNLLLFTVMCRMTAEISSNVGITYASKGIALQTALGNVPTFLGV